MPEPMLLWRLANASTLKVLRGQFKGHFHIILGRTERITDFFSGLPQTVDHKGRRIDIWTEPKPGEGDEDAIPPWRLVIRRMAAGSARPREWYIGSQQPGSSHPAWRPGGGGHTDATKADSDYILLIRSADDRFFAAWLRGDHLSELPDECKEAIEASPTGTQTLDAEDATAILAMLGQDAELAGEDSSEPPVEPPVAHEGQPLKTQHVRRERSRRLRSARIEAAGERPSCEACGFDFEWAYGDRGRGFIECHHIVPISELDPATPTRLDDLALLCANCHRMVHVRQPWLTLNQLKHLLAKAPGA